MANPKIKTTVPPISNPSNNMDSSDGVADATDSFAALAGVGTGWGAGWIVDWVLPEAGAGVALAGAKMAIGAATGCG